uniref:CCHC-type domain-containing protein n=1 Tax=Cacopsylla melanoneura TaxID=428564 RepID=A0A8D9EIL9_9HEMI
MTAMTSEMTAILETLKIQGAAIQILLQWATSFEKKLDEALALETSHRQKVEECKDQNTQTTDLHEVTAEIRPDPESRPSKVPSQSPESNPCPSIVSCQSHSPPRYSTTYKRRSVPKGQLHELGLNDVCLRCGKPNHTAWDCPVSYHKLKCTECKRTGHVDNVCISTRQKLKCPASLAEGKNPTIQIPIHSRSAKNSSSRRRQLKPTVHQPRAKRTLQAIEHRKKKTTVPTTLPAYKFLPQPQDTLGGSLPTRGDCCIFCGHRVND